MMFKEETIDYIKYLYRNIFGKDADNSKEFIIFVQNGNPHPLRIQLEEILGKMNKEIIKLCDCVNNNPKITELIDKISFVTELDAIVMNYIEENGV